MSTTAISKFANQFLPPSVAALIATVTTALGQIASATSTTSLDATELLTTISNNPTLEALLPAPLVGLLAYVYRRMSSPSDSDLNERNDKLEINNQALKTLVTDRDEKLEYHRQLLRQQPLHPHPLQNQYPYPLQDQARSVMDTAKLEREIRRLKVVITERDDELEIAEKNLVALERVVANLRDDLYELNQDFDTIVNTNNDLSIENTQLLLQIERSKNAYGTATVAPVVEDRSEPVSIRHANPGNILSTVRGNQPWNGEDTTSKHRYAKFSSQALGLRAMLYLVRVYMVSYELKTIEKIISRWSPHDGEGNSEIITNNYINFVAERVGIAKDDVIGRGSDIETMVIAMAEFEAGKPNPHVTREKIWQVNELIPERLMMTPLPQRSL